MTATTTWATLISLSVNNDFSLSLVFNPILVAGVGLLVFAILVIRWWWGWRGPDFTVDTVEMGVGSHKIKK
jgi:cytochrome b